MLITMLQCIRQPLKTKNYLAENVNNSEADKPCRERLKGGDASHDEEMTKERPDGYVQVSGGLLGVGSVRVPSLLFAGHLNHRVEAAEADDGGKSFVRGL